MTTTINRRFAALGDPTRVEIMARLSRGAATVSELAEPYDMLLRGVLKHVELLEDAGLVRTHKVGRVRHCALDERALDETTRWIEQLRRRWERRIDRFEEYACDREGR
ncbi:MAG: ArsR/SmtB family transcription factor [Actinomycetota bacterium]